VIPVASRCRAVPAEPAALVIRDDADIIVWNTGLFKLGHDARAA